MCASVPFLNVHFRLLPYLAGLWWTEADWFFFFPSPTGGGNLFIIVLSIS